MKKIYTVLALCWAASAALAVVPQPDLLARIHFAGGDTIAADKNYAPLPRNFPPRKLWRCGSNPLTDWLPGWPIT